MFFYVADNPDFQEAAEDSFSAGDSNLTSAALLVTDPTSLYPVWSKANSSESEWSDVELGGAQTKTRALNTRVRQASLACFHALVRVYTRVQYIL